MMQKKLPLEFSEENGRWMAQVPQMPGLLGYGTTREEAQHKVESLLRALETTDQRPHSL